MPPRGIQLGKLWCAASSLVAPINKLNKDELNRQLQHHGEAARDPTR